MESVVTHMVWTQVKEDTTEDQVKFWIESTKMLRDIPGVLKVEAGRNFTTRTNHQLGLLVLLKDKEALTTYATHPIHLKFIEIAANDIKVAANALDFINESI